MLLSLSPINIALVLYILGTDKRCRPTLKKPFSSFCVCLQFWDPAMSLLNKFNCRSKQQTTTINNNWLLQHEHRRPRFEIPTAGTRQCPALSNRYRVLLPFDLCTLCALARSLFCWILFTFFPSRPIPLMRLSDLMRRSSGGPFLFILSLRVGFFFFF